MENTGHKSAESLQRYRRVNNEKKMEMGKVLAQAINKTHDELMQQISKSKPLPPVTTPKAIEGKPSENLPDIQLGDSTAIVPFEPDWDNQDSDFDLLKILSEIDDKSSKDLANVAPATQSLITTTSNVLQQQQCNSPMFAGYQIGKITINIVKKLLLSSYKVYINILKVFS